MNNSLEIIQEKLFDNKEKIPDGLYIDIMNELKIIHDLIPPPPPDYDAKVKNIKGVINSWILNNRNTTSNNSFSTRNGILFSYDLMIGTSQPTGKKYIYNYMAGGLGFKSQATSRHVSRTIKHFNDYGLDFDIE